MNDKLIVALDVSTPKDAERLVKTLAGPVKIFKIGKELFTSAGPSVVEMVHSHGGKVFLDLKFHDIPNTVAGACAAAVRLKVFMLNVHALGGKAMMQRAALAVREESEKAGIHPPLLIGVTVLTSLADADLKEIGVKNKTAREVKTLALLAEAAGLGGVVASPLEIALIKKAVKGPFCIVTPGVRSVWAAHGDQKRVMTPKEAIAAGAGFIVVGRPITQDPDPRKAAEKVLKEIQ